MIREETSYAKNPPVFCIGPIDFSTGLGIQNNTRKVLDKFYRKIALVFP